MTTTTVLFMALLATTPSRTLRRPRGCAAAPGVPATLLTRPPPPRRRRARQRAGSRSARSSPGRSRDAALRSAGAPPPGRWPAGSAPRRAAGAAGAYAPPARRGPSPAAPRAAAPAWSRRRLHRAGLRLDQEVGADGELVRRQPHRLLGHLLGDPGHLEEHPPRLHHRHPALGRALAAAHAGLGGLLGVGVVGEDADPDLAAAADVTGHRASRGLDLAVGDPRGLERLETVGPEGDVAAPLGGAAPVAAVDLAMLGALRHQHGVTPPPPRAPWPRGPWQVRACAARPACGVPGPAWDRPPDRSGPRRGRGCRRRRCRCRRARPEGRRRSRRRRPRSRRRPRPRPRRPPRARARARARAR